MKSITISQVNTKGQLVIPKDIRSFFGITKDVALQISIHTEGILISPISRVVKRVDHENSFLKTLALTRGAWGTSTSKEKTIEAKRREIELLASKRNKSAW